MTNTIVSAFVSNINNRENFSLQKYYNYGKHILKLDIPKIIFLDNEMYNLLDNNDYSKKNTVIVKIKKEDIYLYDFLLNIKNNICTDNPNKDTIEYMFIQCSKTEWIKNAIILNHFKSNNFIWIDFGIRYIFKCDDNTFIKKINTLKNKLYDNIRIGHIWNLNKNYNINIYKNISWYFAGGIFGGNYKKLLIFSKLMKEKCIKIIKSRNSIMWEVNIWYLIYLENKELFQPYLCNHNNTIIDNY